MIKIRKICQLVFSKAETGLWYDHDEREYNKKGWGICIKLFVGPFARPIKFNGNPWKEKPWFVLRLPFIILPFISIAFFNYGFYIGGKVFRIDEGDRLWSKPEEWDMEMLTFSFTTRLTRWK